MTRNRKRYLVESLEQRCLLASDVVINEIHYDPPDKTQPAEYIELFNNSNVPVDVSGWSFTAGIDFRIPVGTTIGTRQFLVVAQNPVTAKALFGVDAIGPWAGQLKNSGERIELRNEQHELVDLVDYQRGFPWPTVGVEPGHTIELIHPDLENDLGGNWRRAGSDTTNTNGTLIPRRSDWKFYPGTEEPSADRSAWRRVDFDDSSWQTGRTPIGYGDGHVATRLDMQGNYSSIYLRKEFEIGDVSTVGGLTLTAQFDDGINVWINGEHVARENVSSSSPSYNTTASSALENLDYIEFDLGDPSSYLVSGANVVAVQLLNASLNGSSDAWIDAELSLGVSGNHSAGSANTVLSENAAPATRKVDHSDATVDSGKHVVVTAKVTDADGVGTVKLEYQVVRPGDYFGRYLKATSDGTPVLNPRYDDANEWNTIVMNDSGVAGDTTAGDDVYSGLIPASVQEHRHLIRYRIHASDSLGAATMSPHDDDPQHNFAYFVYDEIPDWTGSIRPGREPELNYELSEFNSIATYHLLTSQDDHQDSLHIPDTNTSSYGGSEYLWPGTMVYDGEVYDNIRYRARGGVWRYAMGKNMWKFDFNRGRSFQAKDDYGNEYSESWDKLNFSALIQQGNYLHRGEQGLFESVGFKLFNLAGVESPNTHYVHFRVIDAEDETGDDQYSGDFQGLYLAVEQPDGRMLEEHGLPDGNLYKIEGHQGSSNNQGPTQVSDGSDVSDFIAGYRNSNPSPDWWAANLDLDRYYSYRTIVDSIHQYDIAYGKNYFYYNNPETGKFQVHPWDLDLTWANNMFGSGEHDFVIKVARNDAFRVDYENRVRELRDLLYNEEQTGLLIDEFAALVDDPDELSWVDADRARWDFDPILSSSYVNSSKAGLGRFYERSETDDFAGMVQLMKDYVAERSDWLDRRNTTDRRAPETPSIEFIGADGYPINDLTFATSAFTDPEGGQFAAMEWRIAEITDPDDPKFGSAAPNYEIAPTWESGELSDFSSTWTIPSRTLSEGSLYRVRVRMSNADGIWSHWSEPQQFVASKASSTEVVDALRISEIHYHPADPSALEISAGFDDPDEFEFIELQNVSAETISLANTAFRRVDIDGQEEGVEFEFDEDQELEPGERVLVVENVDAFEMRYGDDLPVAGQWSGKLGNSDEFITLVDDGTTIHAFAYDDTWHASTDGEGYSLEKLSIATSSLDDWTIAAGWKPSEVLGGTPGTGGSVTVPGDFDGNQIVDTTDIDLLNAAIAGSQSSPLYDLNEDGFVTDVDVDYLVVEILDTYRGDLNLDGQVGFADFLILAENFGMASTGWSQGDVNGDNSVSFADFLILASNFGNKRELP